MHNDFEDWVEVSKQFEGDLELIKDKLQDKQFAQSIYAALCNRDWIHTETGMVYSCSWRYAGSSPSTRILMYN